MIGAMLAAAVVAATPATLPGVLSRARGGDVIRLADGDYATVKIDDRRFSPRLEIAAGRARVAGVVINKAEGVTWRGGSLSAPGGVARGRSGYAVSIFGSRAVTVREAAIGDAARGIVMGDAQDILIAGNRLVGFTIDGINIGSNSNHITIDGNFCESFATGEAHPDCIQGWSRAGRPVSDIVVTNNTTRGIVQGIFFGNIQTRKARDGSENGGDPGYDRIRIEHNIVEVKLPNGIVTFDCRDCVIRYNRVSSLPGANRRAKVLAVRGNAIACGNTVANLARLTAVQPCK